MAKMDKFGFFSGRGAKQRAMSITKSLNRSFRLTGGKYKASTLRIGKEYRPIIEQVKR